MRTLLFQSITIEKSTTKLVLELFDFDEKSDHATNILLFHFNETLLRTVANLNNNDLLANFTPEVVTYLTVSSFNFWKE
jgi:hypothetical protein